MVARDPAFAAAVKHSNSEDLGVLLDWSSKAQHSFADIGITAPHDHRLPSSEIAIHIEQLLRKRILEGACLLLAPCSDTQATRHYIRLSFLEGLVSCGSVSMSSVPALLCRESANEKSRVEVKVRCLGSGLGLRSFDSGWSRQPHMPIRGHWRCD